ncbi:sugar ABC transporter ATP-binding protein [Pseudofrankia inefficax]|uniref:ABC transporter related protein n=1 Tax=Pseudofrankia inefficax (strain DSM 45817 / CECT 9037 / DDB 130130 / EuI1c) TaxID=298654 RepID=E3J942_PSEI1|nr:sugar ABC transporter ATP-binding protein [Pseudofrankia inefficax]ADP80921.1 ABC transporter related protein [Pseudofrankia inefficax]
MEMADPAPAPSNGVAECLRVSGLSKAFPGVRALRDVDLTVARGEIHALAGGNGSGKSTLIKIVAGVEHGDAGTIRYPSSAEVDASGSTPEVARGGGVYVVHQDLGLFPDLTVAENFALGFGFPQGRSGRVRWKALRRRAAALIERFEIPTTPDTVLRDTSRAVQAQIAIARALQVEDEGGAQGLLVLDEPTAALPAHEVALLFASLRRYVAHGRAALFVSHRLDEVLDLADRVTVFRDGQGIGTYSTSSLTEAQLAELIAGRPISRLSSRSGQRAPGETLLELTEVQADPLDGINLTVRSGEVVGVAGLLGSGRTELLRCIYGDLPIQSGTVRMKDKVVHFTHPRDAIKAGIGLVPESRSESVFYDLAVYVNLAICKLSEYSTRRWLSDRLMRAGARERIATFGVRAASESVVANVLSGGNQQKVVLGRWLSQSPTVLLLDEPTHGVDVGARQEIYQLVRQATDAGMGVLLVASDFEEIALNCDRAIVLSGGRVVAEVGADELTAHALIEAAYTGTKRQRAG